MDCCCYGIGGSDGDNTYYRVLMSQSRHKKPGQMSYCYQFNCFILLIICYLCQGGSVIVAVCLSVSNFAQKLLNGFA